jgi:hypothetical protein
MSLLPGVSAVAGPGERLSDSAIWSRRCWLSSSSTHLDLLRGVRPHIVVVRPNGSSLRCKSRAAAT